MGARKSTGSAGTQDRRATTTQVGHWYAEGPADRPFLAGDPAFSIFRVVADDAEVPGCVTVENNKGRRFPMPTSLVDAIAAPTRLQAGDLLDQPVGQREHGA